MFNIGKSNPENSVLSTRAWLIASSFSRLTGKELLSAEYAHEDIPRTLFEACFIRSMLWIGLNLSSWPRAILRSLSNRLSENC